MVWLPEEAGESRLLHFSVQRRRDEEREKRNNLSGPCDREWNVDGDGVRYSPQNCKVAHFHDIEIDVVAGELKQDPSLCKTCGFVTKLGHKSACVHLLNIVLR